MKLAFPASVLLLLLIFTQTLSPVSAGLDFKIDMLVSDKNQYGTGENARLWARIQNTGTVEIDTASAYFTVFSPSGRVAFTGTDGKSIYLKPGAVAVFEAVWMIPSAAEAGRYRIHVSITAWQGPGKTGASTTRSAETRDAFSVNAPSAADFYLSVSPTYQIADQGQSTSFIVTVTSTGGWTSQVTLSVSGLPGGASSAFSSNPVTPTASSTLRISISPSTIPGQFNLVILGISGTRQHTTTATLVVQAQPPPTQFDFTVSAYPVAATIPRGSASYASTISVTLTSGSAQRVDLVLSGLPSNVGTYSFSPPYGNPSFTSSLSIGIFTGAPIATYTLTITGSGGGKTRSTTITLSIIAESVVTVTERTTVTVTQTVWSGRTVYAPTQTVTKYTTGIVTVTSYSPTITITVQGSGSSLSALGVLGIVAFLGSVACARERKRHEH